MRCRPATALLLLLLGSGCSVRSPAVPAPTKHPLRVMSVNQCTDQLVLALLPTARIASVSWLARDRRRSAMAAAAMRVATNRGSAEDVLVQRPDLVVADSFGQPALRAMLRRLGYPMVEVNQPAGIEGIRRAARQVAAAVDARPRGEALVARMDAQLADLARHPAPPLRVAMWSRDGVTARAGGLDHEVLAAAGLRNVADEPATTGGGIEALLVADPALLVLAGSDPAASLGDLRRNHPIVRARWRGRSVALPSTDLGCGTPRIAAVARRLRDEVRGVAGRPRS